MKKPYLFLIICTSHHFIYFHEVMVMKVKIIKGPHTDKNIQACYDIIIRYIREGMKHDSHLRSCIDRRAGDKRV